MNLMIFVFGIIVGLLGAYFILKRRFSLDLKTIGDTLSETNIKLSVSLEQVRLITEQSSKAQIELENTRAIRTDLEKKVASMEAENRSLADRILEIPKIKDHLSENMESMMRKVHEASYDRATKASKEQLSALIDPFKEKLDGFGQTVKETHEKGTKETLSLKNYLENFGVMHKGLMQQTESLTRALRGDSKVQGDWGEMILEGLLESTGLREGHEYIVQGKGLGLKSEDGKIKKPDVIVRLPQEKDVIIDSKMSLTAYERYFRSDSEEQRTLEAEALVESIENHFKSLTKRDYASLYGINSPDYVLMFIPIDGAYLLASQYSPGIYQAALEKGIHLVSPSFLMPALRMIHNLWERDKQSKNAIRIAEEAGKLCDKFVDFVTDVQEVQLALGKAGDAAENAIKKLKTGNGNLIKRVEDIKKLGARAKKQLKISEEPGDEHEKVKGEIGPSLKVLTVDMDDTPSASEA